MKVRAERIGDWIMGAAVGLFSGFLIFNVLPRLNRIREEERAIGERQRALESQLLPTENPSERSDGAQPAEPR